MIAFHVEAAEKDYSSSYDPSPRVYDALINEEYVINGLSFVVESAKIISTNSAEHSSEAIPAQPNVSRAATAVLAIRHSFVNNNPTKKIDLYEPFQFMLSDEYGNQYRMVARPNDFLEPTAIYAENFPSVYPGQRVVETIFF